MDKTKILAVLQETFGVATMYWSLAVAVLASAVVRAHFTEEGWANFLQDEWEVIAFAVVLAGILVRFIPSRGPAKKGPASDTPPTDSKKDT